MIKIGIPKGRIEKEITRQLITDGIINTTFSDSRKLIINSVDDRFRFILLKPSDIPVYVNNGVLDLGVVGKDTLFESNVDIYEIEEFEFSRCRMSICGFDDSYKSKRNLKIGTKYTKFAKDYFEDSDYFYEVIELKGSVELAPILGLSDIIIDIVETGRTLKENGLKELEILEEIYPVMISNKVSFKTKKTLIEEFKSSVITVEERTA